MQSKPNGSKTKKSTRLRRAGQNQQNAENSAPLRGAVRKQELAPGGNHPKAEAEAPDEHEMALQGKVY